jgi:hypothetical protein
MQLARHLHIAFVVVEHRADAYSLVLRRCRYSSNFSAGTWNARWFIELTALVMSPMPGIFAGAEMPGTASGASANQKNATQSPLPASKKKCWPAPPGISSDLISGMPSTLL